MLIPAGPAATARFSLVDSWFGCSVLTGEEIGQACAAVHEAFAEIR